MGFPFGGYAVQRGVKRARRLVNVTMWTMRRSKRQANRAYRRRFKQAVDGGLEAVSEWNPGKTLMLSLYDLC